MREKIMNFTIALLLCANSLGIKAQASDKSDFYNLNFTKNDSKIEIKENIVYCTLGGDIFKIDLETKEIWNLYMGTACNLWLDDDYIYFSQWNTFDNWGGPIRDKGLFIYRMKLDGSDLELMLGEYNNSYDNFQITESDYHYSTAVGGFFDYTYVNYGSFENNDNELKIKCPIFYICDSFDDKYICSSQVDYSNHDELWNIVSLTDKKSGKVKSFTVKGDVVGVNTKNNLLFCQNTADELYVIDIKTKKILKVINDITKCLISKKKDELICKKFRGGIVKINISNWKETDITELAGVDKRIKGLYNSNTCTYILAGKDDDDNIFYIFDDMYSNEKMLYLDTDILHNGYINGFEDHSFKPEKAVTREEFATMIYKIDNMPQPAYKNFEDVYRRWSYYSVCYSAEKGWIEGYDDGLFHPEDTITFAEACKILCCKQGIEHGEAEENEHWGQPYIDALCRNRDLTQTFDPDYRMTRRDIVQLINASEEIEPDKVAINDKDEPFIDVDNTDPAYYDIMEAMQTRIRINE